MTSASTAPSSWNHYLEAIQDLVKLLIQISIASYAIVIALKQQFDDLTGRRPMVRHPKARPQLPPGGFTTPAAPADPLPLVFRERFADGIERYSPMTDDDLDCLNVKSLRSMARSARVDYPDLWTLEAPIHLASKKHLIAALLQLRSTTGN